MFVATLAHDGSRCKGNSGHIKSRCVSIDTMICRTKIPKCLHRVSQVDPLEMMSIPVLTAES